MASLESGLAAGENGIGTLSGGEFAGEDSGEGCTESLRVVALRGLSSGVVGGGGLG